MAKAREVCRRALVRSRVCAPDEDPSGPDIADTLARLNDMMFEWQHHAVDVGHEEMSLDSEFSFFVPPLDAEARSISALAFVGGWDASLNSPALESGQGVDGQAYKVTAAGTTALDGVSDWAVGDYAMFCAESWLKGRPSRPFEGGIVSMLAMAIGPEFGTEPTAVTARDAASTWLRLQSAFVRPDSHRNTDLGIVRTTGRRYGRSSWDAGF